MAHQQRSSHKKPSFTRTCPPSPSGIRRAQQWRCSSRPSESFSAPPAGEPACRIPADVVALGLCRAHPRPKPGVAPVAPGHDTHAQPPPTRSQHFILEFVEVGGAHTVLELLLLDDVDAVRCSQPAARPSAALSFAPAFDNPALSTTTTTARRQRPRALTCWAWWQRPADATRSCCASARVG